MKVTVKSASQGMKVKSADARLKVKGSKVLTQG
jgi:hypothetical protein